MHALPNENELLRILLLLADTQAWLDELAVRCIHGLHPAGVKLFNGKAYRMSVSALAHIAERHYYKTLRHPGTGKFTISLADIMDHIREAAMVEAVPVKGNANFRRRLELTNSVGTNKHGEPAFAVVVITDAGGNIVTAFPE